MQKNFDTLEVGGYYLDRTNHIHGPLQYRYDDNHEPFSLTDYITTWDLHGKWRDDKGTYNYDLIYDLIQKVEVTIKPMEQKKDIKLFVGAVCELNNGEIAHFQDYAEKMRLSRIKSLEKQIEKLKKMEF